MSSLFDIEFPLVDEAAKLILMHRDVHFGMLFSVMMDYYRDEGKGVCDAFDLEQIEFLAQLEKQQGVDLSSLLLSEGEQMVVVEAQRCYQQLRDLCELKESTSPLPRCMAELILSETEEQEDQALAHAVAQGKAIVPELLNLLQNAQFQDPLFPGYGLAPALAARALGQIGDVVALGPLCELSDVENEVVAQAAIAALQAMQQDAEPFLLKLLQSRPLTRDNQRALHVLLSFATTQAFAVACLQQLSDRQVYKHPYFTACLVLGCEGLEHEDERKALQDLCLQKEFPIEAREEFDFLHAAWKLSSKRMARE